MDPLLEEIVRSRPEALMSESRPDWAQGKERVGGFQGVASPEVSNRRFAAETLSQAIINNARTALEVPEEKAKTYALAIKNYIERLGIRREMKAHEEIRAVERGEKPGWGWEDVEMAADALPFQIGAGGVAGSLLGRKGAELAGKLPWFDKAVKKAEALERQGAPSQYIWDLVKVERGKDGLWRWELPDDAARLSSQAEDVLAGGPSIVGQPFGQHYLHPELFRAHSSLAQIPTNIGKGERGGSYMPRMAKDGPEITAIARDPQMMLRVLTHEGGAHGVQDLENFAIGGSPATVTQGEMALARSRPRNVQDLENVARTAYLRRAGEQEALNVEGRMWDPELRKLAPSLTEDIPRMLQTVRFLQETSPQLAVKEKGGMWHPEAVERLSAPLADKLEEVRLLDDIEGVTPREVPWATRAIRNYLNKHAGTVTDPLKDVEIPFGEGVKRWEELTDATITRVHADRYKLRKQEPGGFGLSSRSEELVFPQVPGSELINDIGTGAASRKESQALTSYLSHVGDYLRQNVAPEKLQQYDLVRAVKETVANDARVAKEMEKAVASSTKDLPVYKEYPDGMKWVELKMSEKLTSEQAKGVRRLTREEIEQYSRESSMSGGDEWNVVKGQEPYVAVDTKGKPVYNSYTSEPAIGASPERAYLAGQLAQEGNQMGHCVGGYCEGVASGKSRIFSLRDGKGRSHVTVEVAPPGNMRGGYSTAGEKLPSSDAHILQIKGKQNRAPAAEYLPYVQDFVRSGKWGEVGDLPNTGLRRNRKTGEYKTDAELLKDNPNFRYNHEWD